MRVYQQGETLSVYAPAKLNLSLKVLGRRPDGFHDLESIMLSIRLTDHLRFFPQLDSDQVELTCLLGISASSGASPAAPRLEANDRNLVVRAAKLLKEFSGCRQGVRIELLKRIPMEAGMGGGSSDAAATLVGLNQFWNLGLTSAELHPLAAQLGSDVNFFLDSHEAAFCTGRGERVEAIPVARPLHLVIVKPPFGLSTAAVFQKWSEQREESEFSMDVLRDGLTSGRSDLIGQEIGNDLTRPALNLNSSLSRILKRLAEEPVLGSGMTGSGSTCFALCRTATQANRIAGRLRHLKLGLVTAISSGV